MSVPFWGSWLQAQTSVRQVRVLGSKDAVEVEVEASDRIVPQTQVLTGPDRLVVDFPNAVPGSQLRSQSVNRGQVKDVRVGLFQSKPPVTRVVLDLKAAQPYQIFPYGRTVMIKVLGTPAVDRSIGTVDYPPGQATRPPLVNATYIAERVNADPPGKPLEVTFRNGLLTIKANRATLSEVLFAVQQRTGAEIAIPAGAEQEPVVADLGPGPAQEVLAHLLNGSKFNFLILNAANDPQQLDRVILSPRPERASMAWTPITTTDTSEEEAATPPAQAEMLPPPGNTPPVLPRRPQHEIPGHAEQSPQ